MVGQAQNKALLSSTSQVHVINTNTFIIIILYYTSVHLCHYSHTILIPFVWKIKRESQWNCNWKYSKKTLLTSIVLSLQYSVMNDILYLHYYKISSCIEQSANALKCIAISFTLMSDLLYFTYCKLSYKI